MKKSFVLLLTIALSYTTSGQKNTISTPVVTGPVTTPGTIFSASIVDLSPYGYLEQEFFLEGKARRYEIKTIQGNAAPIDTIYPIHFYHYLEGINGYATPIDTLYHYKTRIIVRRPAVREKFNGTVVVEWLNVSSMYDVDSDWWQLQDHLMKSGYAWVGVSAQQAGIHSSSGLRKWNPARYGRLDVTADSTLVQDQLRFDIFSQAIIALKGAQKIRPLGNLKPEIMIATGHSQSALMLTSYYNLIQPISRIIDGFLIHGAGGKLRTDIPAKAFKVNAETDVIELDQVAFRQPDTDRIITWEIAGTSHADQTFLDFHSAICKRDFGSFNQKECDQPRCSLIPFYYGFAASVDHLNLWIRDNIVPPAGKPISVLHTKPVVLIERDNYGNAMGGIRLPQFDVPVAMNSGKNSGPGACRYYGSHKGFDPSTLKLLYPTFQVYINKFIKSARENLKSGYILKADTSRMLDEARRLSLLWE